MKLSVLKLFCIMILGAAVPILASADCESDCTTEFATECNLECPMGEGRSACHLVCQVLYKNCVKTCPSPKPAPSTSKVDQVSTLPDFQPLAIDVQAGPVGEDICKLCNSANPPKQCILMLCKEPELAISRSLFKMNSESGPHPHDQIPNTCQFCRSNPMEPVCVRIDCTNTSSMPIGRRDDELKQWFWMEKKKTDAYADLLEKTGHFSPRLRGDFSNALDLDRKLIYKNK